MQYRFSSYVIDTATFSLSKDGEEVAVEPQVLRFLVYLLEHRERVVSRDELLRTLFRGRLVTDNALTVRMRAARQAVGDTGRRQGVIATVQGEGYRFIAPVETRVGVQAPASLASTATGSVPAAPGGPDFAGDLRLAQPSIAILPFDLITGPDSQTTLAQGLTHDVITRVACSRAMLVIARGTAFRFQSGQHDVKALGAALGVRYLCQGAVQVAGARARITVGLADTTTQQELWSDHYDRSLTDVLTLQQELAAKIVSELETEVQRNEIRLATLKPATNLDAWSAYHRGLGHMYRFRMSDCDVAERYFRQALDLEAGLARPHAGLSFVNYERAYLDLEGDRSRTRQLAEDQAKRAIEADPADPMGYWALSRAQFLKHDMRAAQHSVARATELNPSYATAQYFLGWVSMLLGEREHCHERIELAKKLSPQDPLIYGMQGISAMNLALMGRHEQAVEQGQAALEHPDVHYQALGVAAMIFALGGEERLAADTLRRARAVKPDYSITDLLSSLAFQRPEDLSTLTDAFRDIERVL
ncbi:MAG: winged helix-turn-helix domain-containing protein [Pseudomonadota bacterium]